MRKLGATAIALATAVALNTASVEAARRGLMRQWFGRRAWSIHLLAITPAWGLFLLLLPTLPPDLFTRLPRRLIPAGAVLLIASAALWTWTFALLGPERTANGYFFDRGPRGAVNGGPYRWLRNPMYVGYIGLLAGTALATRRPAYGLLAIEAGILLLGVEARAENRPFKGAGRSGHVDGQSRVTHE